MLAPSWFTHGSRSLPELYIIIGIDFNCSETPLNKYRTNQERQCSRDRKLGDGYKMNASNLDLSLIKQSTSSKLRLIDNMRYSNAIVTAFLPALIGLCNANPITAQANYGNYGLPLEGQSGKIYFGYSGGVNVNTQQYIQQLGHKPAIKNEFFTIGANGFDNPAWANSYVTGLRQDSPNTIAMLTLEPWGGLSSLTPQTYAQIALQCIQWNQAGSKILIRFAHEQNGNWYPWSGQPAAHIAAFRNLAGSIKWWQNNAGVFYQTMMLWSPNVAWQGIQYSYLDFYPGDDVVDWVGLSDYLMDDSKDAYSGQFSDSLTNNGNFYQTFCVQRGKPLILSETSAPTYIGMPTLIELERKIAWFSQIYSPYTTAKFPMLRAVVWFEYTKEGKTFGSFTTPQVSWAFKGQLQWANSIMVYAP